MDTYVTCPHCAYYILVKVESLHAGAPPDLTDTVSKLTEEANRQAASLLRLDRDITASAQTIAEKLRDLRLKYEALEGEKRDA